MRRILVTGVGGFVGYHLARELSRQDISVLGIGRHRNKLTDMLSTSPGFEFQTADIALAGQLAQAWPERVDVVYHLAGQPSVWYANRNPASDFTTNAAGTVNVLERLKELGGGKIVFASTGDVYGDGNSTDETDEPHPTNFYGLSKLVAENYIKLYGKSFPVQFSILRFSLLYGPYFRRNVLFDILRGLTSPGEAVLYCDLRSQYDLIYVEDAVEALLQAADPQWDGALLNVSNGNPNTVSELLESTQRLLVGTGVKAVFRLAEDRLVKKALPNDRVKKMGWTPKHTLDMGLSKTVDWWKSNGN